MRLNFTANIAPIYTSIKLFSAFVCLFFSINFIAAQKINDAEYKYFIQKQVKNPTLQAELQKIHEIFEIFQNSRIAIPKWSRMARAWDP